MSQHDLVIRNGTIVDGSGDAPTVGDVAIDGGKISQVGERAASGHREIDAEGLLVTPGFVDIHSHYDAQATWDPTLSPASFHGVTTTVVGNCGVGFAPVRESDRQALIDLMEGVEDIPGAAMHEGIEWEWETFPQFMDALDRRSYALDFGVQVPHCAVRVYAMGERGMRNEPATKTDIEIMAAIVREGIEAGALGFSTSRTELHRTLEGEAVPGTFAEQDELFAIANVLGELGTGVFQMAITHREVPGELRWVKELARSSGRTVTFNLQQIDENPALYKESLKLLDEARAEGITNLRGQFSGRPVGILMGWQTSVHPFIGHPTYQAIAKLPIAERLDQLRKPEVRAQMVEGDTIRMDGLSDKIPVPPAFLRFLLNAHFKMYPMGVRSDYEPDPSTSIKGVSERTGTKPAELIYDALMDQDGAGLIYFPLFGYADGNLDAILETMRHPQTGLSLADGGAHCGTICDGGTPTFMLMHWVRDRVRGEKLPLEFVVRRQTRDTAVQYGLRDRGLLAPGMKADLNVIDFENLGLTHPEVRFDLPANGKRLFQAARGYRATVVSGEVTLENDELTGALPGRLIRGEREAT